MKSDDFEDKLKKSFLLSMGIISIAEKIIHAGLEEISNKRLLLRDEVKDFIFKIIGEPPSSEHSTENLEEDVRKIAEKIISEKKPPLTEKINQLKKEAKNLNERLKRLEAKK